MLCLQIQWWLLCSLRQAPFQRFIVDAIFFKMVNHSLLLFFLVTWHAFCIAFRILQNATTTPINGGMSKDPWMLSSHSMCDYHYWLEESINCSFFLWMLNRAFYFIVWLSWFKRERQNTLTQDRYHKAVPVSDRRVTSNNLLMVNIQYSTNMITISNWP
jgi:hypothetical protein